MANSIIGSSGSGIVIKETPVHLSDEKLKGLLSQTYERAQKDMSATKPTNFYGLFLSVAGTLFLSLLTSDYKGIGAVSAEIVTISVWIICILCALIGIILLLVAGTEKTKRDTSERDTAVNEVFQQCISNGKNSASEFIADNRNFERFM